MIDFSRLSESKIKALSALQLRAICKELDIKNTSTMKKSELVSLVLQSLEKAENNTNMRGGKSTNSKKNLRKENQIEGNTSTDCDLKNEDDENSEDVVDVEVKDINENSDENDGIASKDEEENSDATTNGADSFDDLPTMDFDITQDSEDLNENKKFVRNGERDSSGDVRNEQFNARGYKNDKNKVQRYQKSTQGKKQQNEEIDLSECEIRSGILEISPDGFGFLRAKNFRNSEQDTYVSQQKIRKCGLRAGDLISAYTKSLNEFKPPALIEPITINDKPAAEALSRPFFENFVPIYPKEKLRLEVSGKRNDLAVRAIDLIAPIGKGQRAMVVSPPKAGKTTLLKMIANSISENNPEVKLMVLLIDERPEEVTDMQRSINGEVIYSTFDEESDNHIRVAELVLARAKRIVESGQDVVILLDSLTRMARANNVIVPSSGKTLSGGVDPVALYFPKRFFGAARNIENGASLTIIATALVDTGSRMDDIVYEEFKGTGNMEIHLDRRLSEKRIFPAIDLLKSGTRREELLLSQKELEGVYTMRRLLSAGDSQEAAESIITIMMRTNNNDELITCMGDQLAKLKKEGWRI